MARRRVRRKNKLNTQTWISIVTVSSVVLILLLVVGIKGIELAEKNAAYEETIASLEQEIADEEERAEEIEEYSEYVDSEEYIEKIARERLGLINEDELILYSENE